MKKYIQDYVPDSKVKDNGKIIQEVKYAGDYYEYSLSAIEYQRMRRVILIALVMITVIYLPAGFLNNSGSFCFYVLLPYITIFLPLTYLLRAYIRTPRELQRMEFAIYDKSYLRVKFSLVGIIATSLATVVGDIVFIVRNVSEIALVKEVVFCIGIIVILVIAILVLRYHNRIVCDKL